MEELLINIYPFSELNSDAQDVAISNFRQRNEKACYLIREAREVLEIHDNLRYFRTGMLYSKDKF